MKFLAAELAEFRKLCADDPDEASREAPTQDGILDLTRAKAFLVLMAQNRALGAMLEEALQRPEPKRRTGSKVKPAPKRR